MPPRAGVAIHGLQLWRLAHMHWPCIRRAWSSSRLATVHALCSPVPVRSSCRSRHRRWRRCPERQRCRARQVSRRADPLSDRTAPVRQRRAGYVIRRPDRRGSEQCGHDDGLLQGGHAPGCAGAVANGHRGTTRRSKAVCDVRQAARRTGVAGCEGGSACPGPTHALQRAHRSLRQVRGRVLRAIGGLIFGPSCVTMLSI